MRVLALLLVAIATPALAEEPLRFGVLDFVANGASPQLASAVGGVTANELQRLGLFEVITNEAVRDLLAHERQRQLIGCGEAGCMTELASALGVDYLVSGKVSRAIGEAGQSTLTLELTLLNVQKGKREASSVQNAATEVALVGRVSKGVTSLVSGLLSSRSGSMLVSVSEPGAVVKVDDAARGSSPLSGRLALSAGPHTLEVEKDGFVAEERQVRIAPGQLLEQQVTLVPSPDFIREYEARAGRMRLGAWLSTGLAVGAAGAAAFFQLQATAAYGSAETPGTFQFHRAKLLEGIESEGGTDHRALATQLKQRVDQSQLFSYLGAGTAGAAAIAAAYFWIAGEDPGRYRRFHPLGAGLAPTGDGPQVTLSLAF